MAGALHQHLAGLTLVDRLGLDYGLHPLNVDADVLEMAKYVKDYKIILVYLEDRSKIDSSFDVNRNLTPMCHRNLKKEWKQPASSVEGPIVVESDDPFEDLDEILGEYANTRDEITGKQMVVHVGNSSIVDDVLDLQMLFETEKVGHIGKFKEVEDLDYDPKHDEVFDDNEHIVEDVHVSMNNFNFNANPRHDLSIGVVKVQEHDIDVIDYDSFGSDLDDGIDSERRIQLKELRRIGKQKNKVPNKYYFYLGQKFATKEIVTGRIRKHSVETRRRIILVKNDKERVRVRFIRKNNISGKQNILGKDKTFQGKGKRVIKQKEKDKYSCPWTMLVAYSNEYRWEVRTLIEDHNCIQLKEIKACASRFLSDHVIKTLATNPDIPVRAVQDQMQKKFDVGVLKMKAFRAKRIATDKMTSSFREQYSLLREYDQELINQNLGTTIRIDMQQELNPESLTRTLRREYVCLGALKQGFRACGKEILGLDGCFMSGPWPGQILTAVGVDANTEIYPVAYAIVEAESKASWCWFLKLLGEDLGIEANFNYTFKADRQKGLIQAIEYMFLSVKHRYCVRLIHENIKSQLKGGVYKRMLWNVAKSTSVGEFKKKMVELKLFNYAAYDWLMKIPAEQWTRSHFLGACTRVPEDVKVKMQNILEQNELNSKKRKGVFMIEEVEQLFKRGKVQQNTLNKIFKKDEREKVFQQIARFFYTSALSFNSVKNPEFGKMVQMIGGYGRGLDTPSYHEMRVTFLKKEVDYTKSLLEEYKNEWKKTGCTLMSDGWSDRKNRSICNFYVNNPKGTIFLTSIDTSYISKTKDVFTMLDEFVEKIGEDHVVQVVTDNVANYKAVGEVLMDKRKKLFWTPCVAPCIDLMLEDFEKKIEEHKVTIAKGRKVVSFIYNRTRLICLLKEFSNGKELLRPGATRFATSYLTFCRLYELKGALISMFASEKWENSNFAKLQAGKNIESIVLDNVGFWISVNTCCTAAISLIKVL
ncbi:mutator type transposase [Tanacetum coccineum]